MTISIDIGRVFWRHFCSTQYIFHDIDFRATVHTNFYFLVRVSPEKTAETGIELEKLKIRLSSIFKSEELEVYFQNTSIYVLNIT